MAEFPDVLTIEQAGKVLQVGLRTLYVMVRSGEVPAAKIANQWRFEKAKLLEWVRERMEAPLSLRPKRGTPSGPKVFIVDDDPAVLEVLQSAVEEALPDSHIQCATDAMTGLLRIGRLQPNLVVLDVVMKGVDGVELCRRLKADPYTNHMVVVAVSGHSEDVVKPKVMDAGADAFVKKPIKVEDLSKIIKALLASHIHSQQEIHS